MGTRATAPASRPDTSISTTSVQSEQPSPADAGARHCRHAGHLRIPQVPMFREVRTNMQSHQLLRRAADG